MLIRERLGQLLEREGVNRSELARRLGEHRNWVNNRMSGLVEIKADELTRIAEALSIDPSEFFSEGFEVGPKVGILQTVRSLLGTYRGIHESIDFVLRLKPGDKSNLVLRGITVSLPERSTYDVLTAWEEHPFEFDELAEDLWKESRKPDSPKPDPLPGQTLLPGFPQVERRPQDQVIPTKQAAAIGNRQPPPAVDKEPADAGWTPSLIDEGTRDLVQMLKELPPEQLSAFLRLAEAVSSSDDLESIIEEVQAKGDPKN